MKAFSAVSSSSWTAEALMNLIQPALGSITPYPGLRPFETNEADTFFGRERQTDRLLEKLQEHRFLGIVGPSGCGKSSLVNAGMIPALQTGFMADAGSAWFVARLRPGDKPTSALAAALLESRLIAEERASLPEARALVEAALRRGPLGLLELATESDLARRGNLLVVVDQFEELFRMASQVDPNEAEAFVALLLRSARQADVPVYVCITMRSDFLGSAAAFHGLPEAINRGLYLTPRLEREECAEAIAGPARVFGGTVEAPLINRLLNDFGPDPDQLPLLQHALMRMWIRADAAPPELRAARVLTIADYEATGGLSNSLSNHADEAYVELSPGDQELAEVLFRRLSDARSVKRDARAPARVSEIAAVANVDPADVIRVANAFRRADRCFLSPREPAPLNTDQVLDVSHESLLRQWRRLADWVKEEAESALFYQRVKETARAWQQGEAALWGVPDLDRALKWKADSRPTAAWATRYGSQEDYASVTAFLDASEAARKQELARSEAERQRQLSRVRRVAAVSAATAATLALVILGYAFLRVLEYKADFKTFSKVNGVPVGVGPLVESDIAHRSVSVRIVKAGYLGRVKRVEVVDADGNLTTRHTIGTYLRSSDEIDSRKSPAYWEYGYDSRGRVASETAFGKQGELIYSFSYMLPSKEAPSTHLGFYVGPDGLPFAETYSSVAIEYDSKGFERKLMYRGPGGKPFAAKDKAFGKSFVYDAEGRLVEETSLTRTGQPLNDAFGNATLRISYDAQSNPVESLALDATGRPTKVTEGWVRRKERVDAWGNTVEISYFDENDKPVNTKDGYHRAQYTHDARGNIVHREYFDSVGARAVNHSGCHQETYKFDSHDRIITLHCLDRTGKAVLDTKGCAGHAVAYADDSDDITLLACRDEKGGPATQKGGVSRTAQRFEKHNRVEVMTYGIDERPLLNENGFAGWRGEYDGRNHLTRKTYIGVDSQPILIDDGFATALMKYAENGRLVERRYLDTGGAPIIINDGYAGSRSRFDERGNETEVSYFGTKNENVISVNGYAGWRSEFDDFGNEIAIHYFGLQGEPTVTSEDGVAGWHSTFDTWGNEVRRQFVGPDDRPITHVEGHSSWQKKFDARGHVVETRFFDIEGRPALTSWNDEAPKPGNGYARAVYKVDVQGHVLEEAYFGVSDEPVKHDYGFARAVHEYDARGLQTRSSYFGIDGKAVRQRLGYHAVQRAFDTRANNVQVLYFDVDGKTPILTKEGYSRLEKEYGPTGQLLRQAAFGPSGPTVMSHGFHCSVREYDVWGRLRQEKYLGMQQEPVNVNGVYRSSYGYDERGNQTEKRQFDVAEQPAPDADTRCKVLRWTYDLPGNLLTQVCLDANNQLTSDRHGFGRREMTYDAGKRVTSISTFDAQGNPALNEKGYAKETYEYDSLGRRIWIHRFGRDGKRILATSDGIASIKRAYDNLGNLTEEWEFGTKAEPILNKEGFHHIVQKFDSRQQLLEMATYDTANRLVVNTTGFARVTRVYDERGNLTENTSFGADGKLSTGSYGYAKLTNKYTAKGELEEEAYFDRNQRPVDLGNGARIVYQYDSEGNQVEVDYFGADGKPRYPVAKATRTFDTAQRQLEERFLSKDGEPIVLGGYFGHHLARYKYDAYGNKVEELYFDVQQKPTRGFDTKGRLCSRWRGEYDSEGQLTRDFCDP